MSDSVEELLAMNDEAFKSTVDADMRDMLDDETHWNLRDPRVMSRWSNCLVGFKRNMEVQLAVFKLDKVTKVGTPGYDLWLRDKLKWKGTVLGIKAKVEVYIAEAKVYRASRSRDLEEAIRQHKASCMEFPDEAEEADELLWQKV